MSWGEISLYGVRAGWLTVLGDCDWDFDSKEFINCRCSESKLFHPNETGYSGPYHELTSDYGLAIRLKCIHHFIKIVFVRVGFAAGEMEAFYNTLRVYSAADH